MDNLKTLYLSYEGRIGRKSFWLGILGVIVAGVGLSLVLTPIFGGSIVDPSQILNSGGSVDSEALSNAVLQAASRAGWANLVAYLIFFIPIAAITIKRRHDRGSAGMEFWVYAALTIAMLLLQATGMGYTIVEFGGFFVPTPTMLTYVVMMAAGVLGVYLLVVCGFLKGDDGENAYGPDPLGEVV